MTQSEIINTIKTIAIKLTEVNVGTIIAAIIAYDRTKSLPKTLLLSYCGLSYILYVAISEYIKNKKIKLDQ